MDLTKKQQRSGVVVGLVLLAATGCDSIGSGISLGLSSDSPTCQPAPGAVVMALEVLDQVNRERADWGLEPVTFDNSVSDFAADYACTMIEDGFFDHEHPMTGEDFEDRIRASDYKCYPAGENLAAGPQTASDVVDRWMDSPHHQDNILDPDFVRMGLGVRQRESDGRLYWVQIFMGERVENGTEDCPPGDIDEIAPADMNDLSGGLHDEPPIPTGQTSQASFKPLSEVMPGSASPLSDE